MYNLHTIHKINAERCAKPQREDETTRHCSYCVSIRRVQGRDERQIVLHSAKHRNTAFIKGAAAPRFLVEYQACNSYVRKDALIERYFNSAPTGKQNIVS